MVIIFAVAHIPRPYPLLANAVGLYANAWLQIPGLNFSQLIIMCSCLNDFSSNHLPPTYACTATHACSHEIFCRLIISVFLPRIQPNWVGGCGLGMVVKVFLHSLSHSEGLNKVGHPAKYVDVGGNTVSSLTLPPSFPPSLSLPLPLTPPSLPLQWTLLRSLFSQSH